MSSPPRVAPDIDVHEGKAPRFYAAAATSYVLAVAAVALRFWARKLMKTKLLADDWAVAVALLIATAFFADAIFCKTARDLFTDPVHNAEEKFQGLRQGFGHHFEVLPGELPTTFRKHLFAEELFYLIVIGLAKLSMLAFYWRLFKNSIRIPCYILGAVSTCWDIAVILATVFQCVPVSGFWNHNIVTKCVNTQHLFIGTSVPNIVTDLAFLAIPVPYIWRLHTTSSQKIALTGTFMLGGFVTVISIVRLPILLPKLNLSSWNLDYSFVHSVSWSIAESNLTIVAACLPSLGPILSLILYGEPDPSIRRTRGKARFRPWTRNQSSAVMQMRGQPTSSSEIRQSFVPLPDEAYGFSGMEQLHGPASTDRDERRDHDRRDIEMQSGSRWTNKGIQVRTDVTVQLAQK